MNNSINSFTFYRDYYNLIDTISLKDKKELLAAITDYVFKDVEPNLSGHNLAIFNTLKSQLNVSKNKSNSARKENQIEIKSKSNGNQMEIKRDNKTSILSFKFYISNLNISNLLKKEINKWLDYKTERKEYYKQTGFETLVEKIIKASEKYGEEKIVELIEDSIANNWKGIVWQKVEVNSKKEILPSWYGKEIKNEKPELSKEGKKLLEELENEDYQP